MVQIFYDDFFFSFLPNMGRKHYGKLEEKILIKSIFSLFFSNPFSIHPKISPTKRTTSYKRGERYINSKCKIKHKSSQIIIQNIEEPLNNSFAMVIKIVLLLIMSSTRDHFAKNVLIRKRGKNASILRSYPCTTFLISFSALQLNGPGYP